MSLRDSISDLIDKEVVIEKKEGYTWVGVLRDFEDGTIVLENSQHGTSLISLSEIRNLHERGSNE